MYISSLFSIANSLGILPMVCNLALGETWEVGDPVVAISLGKLRIGADNSTNNYYWYNSPEPFGILDRITEMHITGVGISVESCMAMLTCHGPLHIDVSMSNVSFITQKSLKMGVKYGPPCASSGCIPVANATEFTTAIVDVNVTAEWQPFGGSDNDMHLRINHMKVTGVDGDFNAAACVGPPVINAMFPMAMGTDELIGLGGPDVWHLNIPNPLMWLTEGFPIDIHGF